MGHIIRRYNDGIGGPGRAANLPDVTAWVECPALRRRHDGGGARRENEARRSVPVDRSDPADATTTARGPPGVTVETLSRDPGTWPDLCPRRGHRRGRRRRRRSAIHAAGHAACHAGPRGESSGASGRSARRPAPHLLTSRRSPPSRPPWRARGQRRVKRILNHTRGRTWGPRGMPPERARLPVTPCPPPPVCGSAGRRCSGTLQRVRERSRASARGRGRRGSGPARSRRYPLPLCGRALRRAGLPPPHPPTRRHRAPRSATPPRRESDDRPPRRSPPRCAASRRRW